MIVLKILFSVDLNNQRLWQLTGKLFTDGLSNTDIHSLKTKSVQVQSTQGKLEEIYIYVYICSYTYEQQVSDM